MENLLASEAFSNSNWLELNYHIMCSLSNTLVETPTRKCPNEMHPGQPKWTSSLTPAYPIAHGVSYHK